MTNNQLYSQITQTFGVGSQTWVCPSNVFQIRLQCWGAGKSGAQSNYGGAGGAGGAYVAGYFNVVPGSTYYLNCGYGGSGNGDNGEDTWFSKINSAPTIIQDGFLAKGGIGTNNSLSSIGDTIFSGGLTGTYAWSGQLGCGGGGGSSAGPLGVGVNGGNFTTGGTTSNGGGNGGNGTCYTYQSANSGVSPGGGGGGSVSGRPGSGGAGKIIITYLPNCSGNPYSGIVSSTPGNNCGTTFLTASGLSSSPGIRYQWQESSDNLSFRNLTNAISTTFKTISHQDKYYRLRTICTYGDTSYSNVVFYDFTFNPAEPSPSSSSVTIDCGQTASLTASTISGNGLTWFSDSLYQLQIGTGSTYNTSNLSSNTNFYVASANNPIINKNYTITLPSELINLTNDCGNGSLYGSGIVGFKWKDNLPSNVILSDIKIELAVGSECLPGIRYTELNGASQQNFNTTLNCGCNGSALYFVNLNPGDYIIGDTNFFRITNTSNFGFNNTNSLLSGMFARITVSYQLPTPCYSSLKEVPVQISTSTNAGTVSGNQIICQNTQPNSLIFNGINGAIQWQKSVDSLNWFDIPTANSAVLVATQIGNLLTTSFYRVIVSNINCLPSISNNVKITILPLPNVYAGVDQNVCFGSSTVLNGLGAINYIWNNGVINGTSFNPTSTLTYSLTGNDLNGCVNIDQIVINVNSLSNGGVVSSNQILCSGSIPANLTLSSQIGTTIQWQYSIDNSSWIDISGATSTTLSNTLIGTLTNTTYYRAIVASGVCNPSVSTVCTISIIPESNSGIASSNQSICSGSSPSILTLIGNTGTIQWQVSFDGTTWTNISGATANLLSSSQMGILTSTKYYRAVVKNGICSSETSNVITITVSRLSVAGAISRNQTICYGTEPSSIILIGANVGSIQWQYSIDNSSWIDISGATSTTLTNTLMGALTVTTYYRTLLTSGVCSPAASTVCIITIIPESISGIISSNQSICSGSSPSILTLIGNTGTIQWQVSTNATTWTNISGATTNLLLSSQMGILTSTRYYRAVVKNGICSSVTSNVITITVSPLSVAGTVSSNQTICYGNEPSSITLTGNVGSVQWQYSNDNLTWSSIVGATSSLLFSYQAGNIFNTTYFRAIITSGACSSVITNSIVVSVTPLSLSGTALSNQSICSGSTPTDLILTGNTGSIQWQYSSDGISFSNITSATTDKITPGILTNTRYYRALVTNGNCSSDISNTVSIIVYPHSVAGTASSNQSICSGTSPSSINLLGNNGNVQWQVSTNGSTWSNIPGAISSTLSSGQMGNLTSIRYYRAIVTSGLCSTALSNTITISILSLPTINAGIDKSVCSGSSVTLSGTGGSVYSWDGGITNNISFVPLTTYKYTLTGTASNGCQNKDAVLVTVNPIPTVSIVNNNPSIICQGQSFTLSSSSTNATNYQCQWKRNGINVSGATSSSLTDNLAGNYTFFVTSPFGCNATSSIVPISITPSPTVNAGLDQIICAGENVTLTASGSSNYSWNNGVLNGVSFTPTNTNTYTVSTTSTNGCVGTDQVNIEVHNSSYSNLYTTSLGNYFLNGNEYSQSGVYTQTIQNHWGCDSLITLNLTVSYLNLDEIEFKDLTIFPNPSLDGIFNIHSEQSINYFQIEVKDVSGRIQKYLNNLSYQIDLSNLPSGIYLLEIKSLTSSKTIRLIKL